MCVSSPGLSRVHVNVLEKAVIYHIIKKTKQKTKNPSKVHQTLFTSLSFGDKTLL